MEVQLTDINEVSRILANIQDENLIKDFLESLLTENEVKQIAGRWELVKMLDEGNSQRSIAKTLHMSLCKITRGSRELKKENSPLRTVLDHYYKT